MDIILKALVLWAFALTGHAAVYQTAVAPAFQKTATGWGVVGSTATAANGVFTSGVTTQVAGKAITMPATARFAANAGQFAVSAMRLNPAGLVVGAAASWLLGYGLEYAIDHWIKTTPDTRTQAYWAGSNTACGTQGTLKCRFATAQEVCTERGNRLGSPYKGNLSYTAGGCIYAPSGMYMDYVSQSNCPSGQVFNPYGTVACGVSSPTAAPAVDSDFSAPSAATLPDAVATQLASSGKVVPTESPALAPDPVVQPISEPYVDPVSKTTKRDYVRATPSPTPENPFRVRIETYVQPVDSTGTPTADPATAAPDTPQDVCEKNPESAMCQKLDTPDAPEIQTDTKTFSITPDSGWGPDTGVCPADVPLHHGAVYSFKPACDFFSGIRPAVIASAWITAVILALSIGKVGA